MSEPVVLGPFITAFGFKAWYWGCRPNVLVAAPAGFWVAIQAGMMTAGTGGVIGTLGQSAGAAKGSKLVQKLLSASDEELEKIPGAAVYLLSDVKAIRCKQRVVGTNPDFVVETADGRSTKYGLGNTLAFDNVFGALKEAYGDRVRKA